MKKVLSLFLCGALIGSVFTGCSNQSPASSAEGGSAAQSAGSQAAETVTCNYFVPGDEPKENDKALQLINDKMQKDGVGVKLVTKYIPWDSWDSKINIMLSTGQGECDMFAVMNDRVTLANYQARGAVADITDAMEKYGQNITKYDSPAIMKCGQVNGKQYAIPAYWFESSHSPEITIRLDILKKYGISKVPTTFDELTDDYVTVMKNWKGPNKPYLPLLGSNCFDFGPAQKTYDSWPFVRCENMIYADQKGTVKDFFETDEFKQDCANARKWYQLGLINPDVITFTSDQLNNQLNAGDWFVHFGTYGSSIDNIKKNYPDITVDDFGFLDFAPDKPNVRPYGTRNMNAVPKSSQHPEAAVKLVNWIYANQDNYDLFLYGREGTDYKKSGDRQRTDIVNSATSTPLYYFADWLIGNLHFERTATGTPTITNKLLYTEDTKAENSVTAEFTFDASKVQTQMTDVKTVMSSNIVPIATGVKDYESNFPEALKQLKKAGIDQIVDEFKSQFEEFQQKNKS